MPDAMPRFPARLRWLLAGIAISLAALLIAFAVSLTLTSRQFEHALIAEQQAALVEPIAGAPAAPGSAAWHARLAAYRASVRHEARYLDAAAPQAAEIARADALAAMADAPARRAETMALIAAIARGERREVAQARDALYRIRRDTLLFGGLLALAACAAAAVGAMQLHRSNRDLAGDVAARTAELRAIDASRRLFFAKASHELRTPVTAIRILADVALDNGGDARVPLQDIVAQAGFLGHRIDEMLALSQAAEGRPDLASGPCDLGVVLGAAAAQAATYARSTGVTLALAAAGGPAIALADARWLTQALLAVIDNGLKFSDPDGVLDLTLAAAAGVATITVADHGPGIVPRALPRIFDAYYQAEGGKARGGTGLGLALARWVIEQHGGTIHAEPRAGGGCRMVITLPLVEGVAA